LAYFVNWSQAEWALPLLSVRTNSRHVRRGPRARIDAFARHVEGDQQIEIDRIEGLLAELEEASRR
jgi:hypothetical protein